MPRQPADVRVGLAGVGLLASRGSLCPGRVDQGRDTVSGVSESMASEWSAAYRPRLCDAEVDGKPVRPSVAIRGSQDHACARS